jgi:hypothetical protein
MPRKALSFDDVCAMALALPGVEVGFGWGQKALKVRGKLMACPAIHRSAEPGSLVFKLGIGERERLMRENPDVFYIAEHYVKYPSLLVRLARISRNDMQDLLYRAWEFSGGGIPPKPKARRNKAPAKRRMT